MKRRDGFGIPTAIAMCTVLLIVSMGVSSILIVSSALNKVTYVQSDYEITYKVSTNEFIAAGDTVTVDDISDTNFDWAIYSEGQVKALVAESADTVRFYAIYDFEHDDLLAYQSSNFYVTTDGEGNKWLGGLVKYMGGHL